MHCLKKDFEVFKSSGKKCNKVAKTKIKDYNGINNNFLILFWIGSSVICWAISTEWSRSKSSVAEIFASDYSVPVSRFLETKTE